MPFPSLCNNSYRDSSPDSDASQGLQSPADVMAIRDLLGHASIRTTAGYLTVAARPGPRSPLDVL